ncbi:hypothetical protein [Capnocytophaga canis]|uniref:hypothetical protein n=1 Tax=Capnocytophaga canis TaxID=1848903 RepID=UPI0012E0B590|nr:hypothetical protein [Capnocytophaga canis]
MHFLFFQIIVFVSKELLFLSLRSNTYDAQQDKNCVFQPLVGKRKRTRRMGGIILNAKWLI